MSLSRPRTRRPGLVNFRHFSLLLSVLRKRPVNIKLNRGYNRGTESRAAQEYLSLYRGGYSRGKRNPLWEDRTRVVTLQWRRAGGLAVRARFRQKVRIISSRARRTRKNKAGPGTLAGTLCATFLGLVAGNGRLARAWSRERLVEQSGINLPASRFPQPGAGISDRLVVAGVV